MALPTHILLVYGYLLLFAWVLVEQVGVPLPATPVLLAAGALSAEHQLSFVGGAGGGRDRLPGLGYHMVFHRRRYGRRVLNVLCKLSLEPTTCVKRTQISFGRRRHTTLLLGKFVPGLASLTSPIAGQNGMAYAEFLFLDCMGSAIWVGALLVGGRIFGDALKHDPQLLAWVARFSGALLLAAILAVLAGRMYRRRMLLRQLVQSRLEPEELRNQLDAGEEVYIVDLRHPLEQLTDPFTLPGALRVAPDELASQGARDSARPRHYSLLHLPQRGDSGAYRAETAPFRGGAGAAAAGRLR